MPDWALGILALAAVMMRPLGVLVAMPLFASKALGGTLNRNALLLAISLPMLPLQLDQIAATVDLPATTLALFAGKEIVIGFLIGFCAAMPFWAIDMAGTVIDTIRGSSMASVLNPMLGEQSSVFGILFSQVLAVIYMVNGGFNTMLTALYESYQSLPPMAAMKFSSGFPVFIGQQWQAMLELAVNFSLPALVVMVLVDIGLGLVNRSAQQLNVFFIAMPIKSAMALFVLAIGMTYGLLAFHGHFSGFGTNVSALLDTLR